MARKSQKESLPYKLKPQLWMTDMLTYFKVNSFLNATLIHMYYNKGPFKSPKQVEVKLWPWHKKKNPGFYKQRMQTLDNLKIFFKL